MPESQGFRPGLTDEGAPNAPIGNVPDLGIVLGFLTEFNANAQIFGLLTVLLLETLATSHIVYSKVLAQDGDIATIREKATNLGLQVAALEPKVKQGLWAACLERLMRQLDLSLNFSAICVSQRLNRYSL
jgi:hypothetical protein